MGNNVPKHIYWSMCARGYLRNVADGQDQRALAAFRPLYGCFMDPRAYGTLTREYEAFTGHPVVPTPDMNVTVATDQTVPWTITLVAGPPWPKGLPEETIPVPVLLVSYLLEANEPLRQSLIGAMVRGWEQRVGSGEAEGRVASMVTRAGFTAGSVGSWPAAAASSYFTRRAAASPTGAVPSPSPTSSRKRASGATGRSRRTGGSRSTGQ